MKIDLISYPLLTEGQGGMILVDDGTAVLWVGRVNDLRTIKSPSGRIWITAWDARAAVLASALYGDDGEQALAALPNVNMVDSLRFDEQLHLLHDVMRRNGAR